MLCYMLRYMLRYAMLRYARHRAKPRAWTGYNSERVFRSEREAQTLAVPPCTQQWVQEGPYVLCYAMLCYAMLCYAMLCCAMLCCAMLCYMLRYAMLCYAMLCYAMLCRVRSSGCRRAA